MSTQHYGGAPSEVHESAGGQPRRVRALLPSRLRSARLPVWWHEIVILLVLDLTYERLRNLVPAHEQTAINRATKLFDFTKRIHWDVEIDINHWVAAHHHVAMLANYYYSFLHLPVTAGVLVWLFWRHPQVYRSARTVLVTTTAIALISFWLFPMAPPRLLPGAGFVDTLVQFGTVGSWGDPRFASHTNQYAAMPSLHCAWALWVGFVIFRMAKHQWLRRVAFIYPACTIFVVVATANHFVLDAVAGGIVLTLAFAIQLAASGHGAFEPRGSADRVDVSGDREVAMPGTAAAAARNSGA